MTSPTVTYWMNWEWCSIFPSYCRLFPQSYNKVNSWQCCTRELNLPALERGTHCLLRRSSSRNTLIWATGLRERSVKQTQTRACSSHLHFTPKQRGSVTLWEFTDSQIEVTNRESILRRILSGFLSGMAALINGHEQLGWGKKEQCFKGHRFNLASPGMTRYQLSRFWLGCICWESIWRWLKVL